ncbi:MAG: hypothetical protein P8L46_02045, partial [Acidimicrobiales bacterium]|nr:hypothetical protein [Acidimicrobiales bacterium]
MSARVLDSVTGLPVGGALVQVTDEGANDLPGASTTTASDGTFTITGITIEEIGIRIDGEAVDYESGFIGCRTSRYGHDVWPTFGDACTASPGFTADIALDPLGPTTTPPPTTSTPPPTTSTPPPTTTTPPDLSSPQMQVGISPGAIDEDLGGQSACKIPGAKSATVSVIATDPESGVVSASVTVTWTVRRDGDPTVLDSGSSEVSDLGGDAYEATIGPFGDIL